MRREDVSEAGVIRHAGLLARYETGGWRGVLIEGASGCGKSDLALRALETGWRLVADDRTLVWRSGEGLFGRAPDTLAGLIEARGLGVIPRPYLRFAPVSLLVRCTADQDAERTPEAAFETVLGIVLPTITLAPLESSAPAKLAQALTSLGLLPQRTYLAHRVGSGSPGAGGVP